MAAQRRERHRPLYKRLNAAGALMIALAVVSYALLYLPAVIMGIMSFNDAQLPLFPLEGFTWHWYGELFSSSDVKDSFLNSLMIAASTMVISLLIGTPAAFALVRGRFKGRNVLFTVVLLPLVTPTLILAVALLLFFNFIGAGLGVWQVIAGHVLISLPFTVLIMALRLFGFDRSLEEAARDLRARPLQVLARVTLPLMFPGILAAALFAFLLSWDEVLIAFFNIDNRSTLPIYIWTSLRHRITLDLVSLGTLLAALTAVLVVVAWVTMSRKKTAPAQEGVG